MMGSFPACCARVTPGHAATAPPSSVMKIAPFQLTEFHLLPSQGLRGIIPDWRRSSQGLVAVRDFGLADDRFGSNCVGLGRWAACPHPR